MSAPDHDLDHQATPRPKPGATAPRPIPGKQTLTGGLVWAPLGRGRALARTGEPDLDTILATVRAQAPRLDEQFASLMGEAARITKAVGADDREVVADIARSRETAARPRAVDLVDTAVLTMRSTTTASAAVRDDLGTVKILLAMMTGELRIANHELARAQWADTYAAAKAELDAYDEYAAMATGLITTAMHAVAAEPGGSPVDVLEDLVGVIGKLDRKTNPVVRHLTGIAETAQQQAHAAEQRKLAEVLARPLQLLPALAQQLRAKAESLRRSLDEANDARQVAEDAYDQSTAGGFRFADGERHLADLDKLDERGRPFTAGCDVVEQAAARLHERRRDLEHTVNLMTTSPLVEPLEACGDNATPTYDTCVVGVGNEMARRSSDVRAAVDETIQTVDAEARGRSVDRRTFTSAVEYARHRVAARRDAGDSALVDATKRRHPARR